MVAILSAEFGDERSMTNVLSSLTDKFKKDGKIDVPVDSSLIPLIVKGGENVTLSDQEVKDAKDKAVSACGGANDSVCIERKTQEFQKVRLDEKRNEIESSSANIIKGRRLRVTYKDENGKTQTVEVPEGQYFKLGKAKEEATGAPISVDSTKISIGGTFIEIWKLLLTMFFTFAYAFGILITWRTFNEYGYVWQKYAATASWVIIPYSGYIITPAFFGIKTYLENKQQN